MQVKTFKAKNCFTYSLVFGSLAPDGSLTASFSIDGDSDFYWQMFSAWAMVANDGTIIGSEELPGLTITITNQSTGRQYSNVPVALPTFAGTRGLPFILPVETYWAAKTLISVELANVTDNITYTDTYLSFIGAKAFS